MLLTPIREGLEVSSFADAQFRNAPIFALAAYYGREPSPQWQMRAVFSDPRIMALAAKVRVEKHPRADAIMAANLKEGGRPFLKNDIIVEIQTPKGRFIRETKTEGEEYADLLGEEGLKQKYRVNCSYSLLKTSKCDEALETIMGLDEVDDVSRLFRLLCIED